VTTDFVLSCFPAEVEDSDFEAYQRLVKVFALLSAVMTDFDPPAEFVATFLRTTAFPDTSPIVTDQFAKLALFIRGFALKFPDQYRRFIDDHFDRIAERNFSALLIAAAATGDKYPILRFLSGACANHQLFGLCDLVIHTFNSHSGEIPELGPLIGLLNSPQLVGRARELIWGLIHDQKPPLAEFATHYSWRGDWIEQTDYFLALAPSDAVTARVVDCVQNSMGAFHRAYSWLAENAAAVLTSPGFAAVMLKIEIGEFVKTMSDYLALLCEGKSDDEKSEVTAPFVDKLAERVRFLNDVFEDVAPGGIVPDDIRPLLPPLKVLEVAGLNIGAVSGDLAQLRKFAADEKIGELVQVPELALLVDCIDRVIS
jgi:hypothetical protein